MELLEKLKEHFVSELKIIDDNRPNLGEDLYQANKKEVLRQRDYIIHIVKTHKESVPAEPLVMPKIADDENYKKVFDKYGETHHIEKRMGTSVSIQDLKDNQSVCWGDGINYHFLLTKK